MTTPSIPSIFSLFSRSKPPLQPPPSLISAASSTCSASVLPGLSPLVLSNETQLSLSSSMQVAWPSLVHANTMRCRSAYNVQVIVEDNEPEERLIGRFRREVMRAGVIQECKRRRFFENKQEQKKRKSREAAKRNRRRRPQANSGPEDSQETSKSNKADKDEDNWDLPEGDLPY